MAIIVALVAGLVSEFRLGGGDGKGNRGQGFVAGFRIDGGGARGGGKRGRGGGVDRRPQCGVVEVLVVDGVGDRRTHLKWNEEFDLSSFSLS